MRLTPIGKGTTILRPLKWRGSLAVGISGTLSRLDRTRFLDPRSVLSNDLVHHQLCSPSLRTLLVERDSEIEHHLNLGGGGLDFATKHPGSGLHPSVLILVIPVLFSFAWCAILAFAIHCLCSCQLR
jgi:hypothetical protein